MKNNKGFVLIETIIVVTIISLGLISIYSSFSTIFGKTKQKSTHENVGDIYKAYYIGNYLIENNMISFGFNKYESKNLTGNLKFILEEFNVEKMYVIYSEMHYDHLIDKVNLDGSTLAFLNSWNDFELGKINIIIKTIKENEFHFASVYISPPTEEPETYRLNNEVTRRYGSKSSITEAPISSFSIVPSSSTNLMYKMTDDYGISYYYKGAMPYINNNIIFGGYRWKILRLNGDGSVRLIYYGTCPEDECNFATPYETLQKTSYNLTSNDIEYVSFFPNDANSNVKNFLDDWYVNNFFKTKYEKHIVDSIFCSDMSLTGANVFSGETRLVTNKLPTLKCPNKEDAYTVNDITLGNGKLTYPVGLITGDELSVAGQVNNETYYSSFLYSPYSYYTMTPKSYTPNSPKLFVSNTGGIHEIGVKTSIDIRPVINLSGNTEVSGSGTTLDPYKVVY